MQGTDLSQQLNQINNEINELSILSIVTSAALSSRVDEHSSEELTCIDMQLAKLSAKFRDTYFTLNELCRQLKA